MKSDHWSSAILNIIIATNEKIAILVEKKGL